MTSKSKNIVHLYSVVNVLISRRPTFAVLGVSLLVDAAFNGNVQPKDKTKNEVYSSVAQ